MLSKSGSNAALGQNFGDAKAYAVIAIGPLVDAVDSNLSIKTAASFILLFNAHLAVIIDAEAGVGFYQQAGSA